MEQEQKEQALEILDDVLCEWFGDCPSNRPIGEGITSNEYITSQLQTLFDVIKGNDIEESLDSMQRRRNKLNREISKLKRKHLLEKVKFVSPPTGDEKEFND